MVKILNFNSDRELNFVPDRSLWFNPDEGVWFDPDRDRSFDHDRDLPFGGKGIIFRGLFCSACENVDYHIEECCTKCGWHYTQAEFTKTRSPVASSETHGATTSRPPVRPAKVIAEMAKKAEPQKPSVPRVKPRVAARPVPPQPRARKVAQPVSRAAERPVPKQWHAPRAPTSSGHHHHKAAANKKRPENSHCSACGVRVSLRHPYCWNCSHPISAGGRG